MVSYDTSIQCCSCSVNWRNQMLRYKSKPAPLVSLAGLPLSASLNKSLALDDPTSTLYFASMFCFFYFKDLHQWCTKVCAVCFWMICCRTLRISNTLQWVAKPNGSYRCLFSVLLFFADLIPHFVTCDFPLDLWLTYCKL